MKKRYSKNKHLNKIVKAGIGLAFVPPERFEDALSILRKMAKESDKRVQKFCYKFVKYLEKTWIRGKYGTSWNFYMHK